MKLRKKISPIIWLVLALFYISANAQLRQADTSSVYQSIIKTEKQSLLNNVDMIANMQMAFRNDF